MKKLFVFVPAILLVLFLFNSFVVKEKKTELKTTGIVLQSADGGKTWQDITGGLPAIEQPLGFFAGESDLYLHVKNAMYRSKGNLKTPVWEKENVPDLKGPSFWPATSIVFNSSGVMAYNYGGQIYQKPTDAQTWLPILTNFKNRSMRTVFETAGGTVFIGYDHGLYKSADRGKSWKQVQKGLVMDIVESDGVLIATGGNGIMRSTDNGEHWQWVISEGGVGIAVERINGGFAAIVYNTVTKSRKIDISLDHGKTWQIISDGLPPSPLISSIKQVGNYLICGTPDGIFRSADMGKTWDNVHPGIDNNELKFISIWNSTSSAPKKVFSIYSSGDMLYAVAGNTGC
jgi:photosystem II stability/assembly factor-like uncharacterized protein